MAFIETQRSVQPPAALGERFRRLFKKVLRMHENRMRGAALDGLNEHLLRDIGLSPSDPRSERTRDLERIRSRVSLGG